ncbi:MAG: histidine kinase [Sphingobacteriales bacterium]|nr:histidine kinase [Sphingobacteriales bacterium]MBI3718976.1 histidine kinase [Sphingobacteriales bacterium]
MKTAIGFTKEHPFLFMRGTLIRIFGNPPLICAMLLSLKTFKRWHLKQKENEMLVRENANAELQLLKAQVHPHFLFNTLNNIYSFTLSKSAQAEELVEKLSDMLRYMITDCNVELVPLEKEIKMLGDYIGLEKVRYGDRLDLWVDINNTKNNLLIAPLVMIPFVENSFKHGTSMMRGKQWIQLSIKTEDNVLDFTLINSKPPAPVQNKNKTGIGLMNVKKRLALLYPGKHELTVTSNESIFSVRLTLQLQFANEAVLTNFINHQFIYS